MAGTGATRTTSYDLAGRVAASDDQRITTEYTYGQQGDYRGLVSATTYTRTGQSHPYYRATTSWDPDGQPVNAHPVPGLRLDQAVDAAGNQTTRRYTASDGRVLAGYTAVSECFGRICDLQRERNLGSEFTTIDARALDIIDPGRGGGDQ